MKKISFRMPAVITILVSFLFMAGCGDNGDNSSGVVDYTKLKLNEVSGVGTDAEKFYELKNIGTADIPLKGCTIYYNANSSTDLPFPAGEGNLTWTGLASQKIEAGKLFSLIGRNTEGSFTTGLTAQRKLIITLKDPEGKIIDKCIRVEDTGNYVFTDKSYSRIPDGTGSFYFTTPTPGVTNGTSNAGATKLPDPAIYSINKEPVSVTAADTVTVSATVTTMTSVISSVVIQWTVNGTAQTDITMSKNGSVYSASIPAQTVGAVIVFKITATNNHGDYTSDDQNYTVVSAPVDYTKLKLNEVSGVGSDAEKFYELKNIGNADIPLEGCQIYYNANGNPTGQPLPTGEGDLTWTGLTSQKAEAGKLFSLIGRDNPSGTNPGSFTTGLTAQRKLIITLKDPEGKIIDKCIRSEDTGEYEITDKSFSRIPDGTGDFYFTAPTPNAANGNSTAGLTKLPSSGGGGSSDSTLAFSHDSGLYSGQFSLTITAPEGSSIYYSTNGSDPSAAEVGNGYVFKYSAPITVRNRNGQANVLATAANSRNFYMADDDPRGSLPTVYIPTAAQVPKATVIRAIFVDTKGKTSDVATKTYFIGNNLSDYGSNRVISLVSDPDNLVSESKGIMVRGKSSYRWDTNPPYNYRQKGSDWERPAYLEIFEGNANNRDKKLSTGAGIRVRGGWSRGLGQKSFNVYFKEQYGINNLKNYNLIPGAVKADGKTPVEIFKGFMLRNGANDVDYTKFYDVFIQELVSDRSFSTQASVPCVVYLNGEYWGPYNLQERYSDNHTEYKYGVKKENVISWDNGELDDGNSGEETLFWNMMNMRNNDMSIQANYSAFCAAFDIDSFIDYWAAELFVYNEDWPQNNYRLWRTRTVETDNPYGDTKWRYQMFDTEYAMGIYNGGGLTSDSGMDAFDKVLNGEHKYHDNNQLFKALLRNPDFCKKFVNTMMDLYNVNFHPDNFNTKLNNYANTYRPLMNGYYTRWGKPWDTVFQNKVDEARKYLTNIRPAMASNYLPKYFSGYSGIANIGVSANKLYNVTLSVTGLSGASIKVNSVTPNLNGGSWSGKYYSAIPITVTASAAPNGYEFEGWVITGGTATSLSSLTTVVTLTGNAQITAKYKQSGLNK